MAGGGARADVPGLPRGRAALSRLIVREGQRREGVTSAAGVAPRFPRRGQGAGDSVASPPRGERECVGPAVAGTGGMRGDGAPSPGVAWRGVPGPRCTFRALCWRSSKRQGRVGGARAGARQPSPLVSVPPACRARRAPERTGTPGAGRGRGVSP